MDNSTTSTRTALDQAAVALSGLCLVHCLAVPLFVAAVPFFDQISAEHFHLQMLILVLPVSIVALALGPMRGRFKTRVDRWLEDHLPATALADAPRHEAVIVFSDIVGYTALTTENEDDALTMMSVFHRAARKASEQTKGPTREDDGRRRDHGVQGRGERGDGLAATRHFVP